MMILLIVTLHPAAVIFAPCESACVLLIRIIEKLLHRSSPNP